MLHLINWITETDLRIAQSITIWWFLRLVRDEHVALNVAPDIMLEYSCFYIRLHAHLSTRVLPCLEKEIKHRLGVISHDSLLARNRCFGRDLDSTWRGWVSNNQGDYFN